MAIGPSDDDDPIVDLSPLQSLQHIGYALRIRDNSLLTSLAGLEWVVYTDDLEIQQIASLISLDGLSQLSGVGFGGVNISSNTQLSTCLITDFVELLEVEGSVGIYGNGPCE